MNILDIISLIWSVFRLLLSAAILWGIGFAAYYFVLCPVADAASDAANGKRKQTELPFTLAAAAVTLGAALLCCRVRNASPDGVLGMILPLEDIRTVMGLTGNETLLSVMKKDPTNFVLRVFSTPESFSALIGTAFLSGLISLLRRLLGAERQGRSLPARLLNALGSTVTEMSLVVISCVFAMEIRDILIRLVTWGTGTMYTETDGPLLLKILYFPYIIAVGGVMLGVFMKEVTGNSFFAVIFGGTLARMFYTPNFSDATGSWYIVLLLGLVFLLKVLAPAIRRLFKRTARDMEMVKEELPAGEYLFNGFFFLAGIALTLCGSLLYFKLLAP